MTRDRVIIESVENGYIVSEAGAPFMDTTTNRHVFESFETLTNWLKGNFVQHPKPPTP